jgi:hypothetical protein
LTLPELTPERVFSLHPKIRWAGLATDQGEAIFVQMRPGVTSLSPEDADKSFMQLGPLLLTGVCERLAPWAGPLEYVVSRYQKVILIVTRLEKRFLTLTINKEDADIISELILKLAELKT